MSKRRGAQPTEKKADEKFFEDRHKARGEAHVDFRPDPASKSPPDPQRRRAESKK